MEIQKNTIYKHYKGDFYVIEDFALNTETEQTMVVYRGIYRDCPLFVRPISMFTEKLPEDKQKQYGQEYRFQPVKVKSKNTDH